MILVGLTGSIGMGKTTAGRMFADEGAPVFDADAAVHLLYSPGAPGARAVSAAFDNVLDRHGGVDRTRLRIKVQNDPDAFAQLEGIVHPLVAHERKRFLRDAKHAGVRVAVLDIPLLFETGGARRVDVVVVVSAPEDVQRERVLERPGMTLETFEAILARQVPDAEKRAKADFVIDTSGSLVDTRRQIRRILKRLERRAKIREQNKTPYRVGR